MVHELLLSREYRVRRSLYIGKEKGTAYVKKESREGSLSSSAVIIIRRGRTMRRSASLQEMRGLPLVPSLPRRIQYSGTTNSLLQSSWIRFWSCKCMLVRDYTKEALFNSWIRGAHELKNKKNKKKNGEQRHADAYSRVTRWFRGGPEPTLAFRRASSGEIEKAESARWMEAHLGQSLLVCITPIDCYCCQ